VTGTKLEGAGWALAENPAERVVNNRVKAVREKWICIEKAVYMYVPSPADLFSQF
jgi:hypothetical protein